MSTKMSTTSMIENENNIGNVLCDSRSKGDGARKCTTNGKLNEPDVEIDDGVLKDIGNVSQILHQIDGNSIEASSNTTNEKRKFISPLSNGSIKNMSPKKRKVNPFPDFDDGDPTQIDDFLKGTDGELNDLMDRFENGLDLDKPARCEILKIDRSNFRISLVLKSTKDEKQRATCDVEGFWASNTFKKGNTVYLCARRSSDHRWNVDNQTGWIIYEPDLLISCTAVVGSIFCKRKSVLAVRYHGFEPTNRVMTIGSLVHTLLQTVLKRKLRDSKEIYPLVDGITSTEDAIKRMYESGMTQDETREELNQFVPRIEDFVRDFVGNDNLQTNSDWAGKICSIEDIEENVWCPELGLKGKIDVTVKTNRAQIMPLELKTGRSSVSLEHKGQIILYLMMMNQMGCEVSSGLLLYLREGTVKEICASQQEKRDLMVLRNELVYYLTTKCTKGDQNVPVVPPELPDPVDHPFCSKCPYKNSTEYKHLKRIQEQTRSYLTMDHTNYFVHWSALIALEEETKTTQKGVKEIYTLTPTEREKKGRSIVNLKLNNVLEERNGLFKQTLQKVNPETLNNDLLNSGIVVGNYVVLSTDKRPAVATGFVTAIETESVTVTSDRDLRKFSNTPFHLDTYESAIAQTFNLASLSLLLEDTPRSAELRRIIIDKAPATFLSKVPTVIAKKGASILRKLNRVQQRAVLKALATKDYLLINGLPGTGKTATIVALIQLMVELDKTVLITSHTHSAIDNVCLRLVKENVKFLRLGSDARMHENLKPYSEHSLTKNCKSPEELDAVYKSFNVIAVTCLAAGHPLLTRRTLDVCIVDESTQVLQPSVIKALYATKTFVLIGDLNQLPPVIRNKDALNAGMAESLFDRLNSPESAVTLNLNYRMNSKITEVANKLTYNGELLVANEDVGGATLRIPKLEMLKDSYGNQEWLLKALDTSLAESVKVIDTGRDWRSSQNFTAASDNSQNCVNIYEAAIVATLVDALIKGGVAGHDIGVIATYRDQVAQISALIHDTSINVSTVDQFQGQDKSVVIYSCTRSTDTIIPSDDLKSHILNDKRRLTVAITRAKYKLILIGDLESVRQYKVFKKLLDSLDKENYILADELLSFDPSAVLANNGSQNIPQFTSTSIA